MVKVGRDLDALHLHYEDIEGYGLKEVWTCAAAARFYRVEVTDVAPPDAE